MPRPHTGIPLSNGNFGALVWGEAELCVTVNQNDLWDHRGGELLSPEDNYADFVEYARTQGYDEGLNALFHKAPAHLERPRRLPVGRFDFHFRQGVAPKMAELEYESGILTVRLSNGGELRLISVLKQNILYLLDPGRCVESVSLHPASDFPKVRRYHEERHVQPYEILEDGWIIHLPSDPDFTVRAVRTGYGYKIFTQNEGDDSSMERQMAFTSAWWRNYFARTPKITVPSPWWNGFWNFALYKFGAATCPFGKPGGLQGPWHEEYQEAQWCGDFHFNVNMQMIYGAACALGCAEHLLPLFDMIESPDFMGAMRHNAECLFKVKDALWQTHAVDDRGRQVGGISCGSSLDPACGAWTALLYYDYYRYTGDTDFLRHRAWPYISGVMRGYECMLDGDFHIPVAISAEYAASNEDTCAVAGRNPSYQLAAIRKLASILIECAEILHLPERPIWRQILERVPHYTTVMGYDHYREGYVERIGIWEKQDLAVCHRHHSHLGCIWPFDTLPEEPDERMRQIVGASLDHWIGMGIGLWSEWCIPWASIIYTRMGLKEAPMQLFEIWRRLFVNEGMATVYLPRELTLISHRRNDIFKPRAETEIMQMDGSGGFLSAFSEMFAYPRFGKLHLFQGIPNEWQEARIENLTLPGQSTLTAEKSGRVELDCGTRKYEIVK